jgi:hypothetical protein
MEGSAPGGRMKYFLNSALILVMAFVFSGPSAADKNQNSKNVDANIGGWSLSPVFGFISGGLLLDSPGQDELVYGMKFSHRRNGTTWVDIGISRFEKTSYAFLINARANYLLYRGNLIQPYFSTGAGLITSDSGGAFDFLIGAGSLFTITDRLSAEQSYILHYSPSQAFTNDEGNPFNSFETSIHLWF